MKTYKPLLWFFLVITIIVSCAKEKSFEKGFFSIAQGSLKSAVTGDCLGNIVSGTYKADTALNSGNYVEVQVDVTKTGNYTITTDTINGFYFKATGIFGVPGVDTVRLQGIGTPAVAGSNVFTVSYDSTQCTFSVATVSGGTGGTSVFTLAGSPNACTGAAVQGILTAGVQATSSNTATIQVDVTTPGTYSISTTAVNGVTFSGSGTFPSTGAQSITLLANGTPTAAGTFNVPVSVGASSNCSFQITVVAGTPGVYTLDGAGGTCTGATVQGDYTVGTPLNSSNTATVEVNVATAGTYSITTTAVNGISFGGSGIFSSTGVQTVVLTGTGTPTSSGDNDIPVTVGSSSCNFTVNVADQGGQTGDFVWQFTEGGITYQGPSILASLTSVGGANTFEFLGTTVSGDSSLSISIINPGGSILSGVNYNSNSASIASGLMFDDALLNAIYQADASKSGVNLVITLTNIDVANQVVQGTFSGTVKNASNVTKTITNGSFKAQLQ